MHAWAGHSDAGCVLTGILVLQLRVASVHSVGSDCGLFVERTRSTGQDLLDLGEERCVLKDCPLCTGRDDSCCLPRPSPTYQAVLERQNTVLPVQPPVTSPKHTLVAPHGLSNHLAQLVPPIQSDERTDALLDAGTGVSEPPLRGHLHLSLPHPDRGIAPAHPLGPLLAIDSMAKPPLHAWVKQRCAVIVVME